MKLTERYIRDYPPPEQGQKQLFDWGGLHLVVFPNGTKTWRHSYSINGKIKCVTIGLYPVITLVEARSIHLDNKRMLLKGLDPCIEKQKAKQKIKGLYGDSFENIAREWYQLKKPEWENKKHSQQVINSLETYAFPYIGKLPIKTITPLQIFNCLKRISDKAETMSRTKQRIRAVFDYAILTNRADYNPALVMPKNSKRQVKQQPSLPPERLPEFFSKLEKYPNKTVRLALKLLVLTFLRSSELRLGEWSEIKGNEWHIPAQRMKMKRPHIVPLSDWALEILEELKALSKNHLIISGRNNKPICDATLSSAMIKMGYRGIAVPHGFRAMASTILNESGLFNPDAIEKQLSHRDNNKVRAAYNRGEYLEERHKIMTWYSNYLKTQYEISKKKVDFHYSDLVF